jgi:hypothetical protein
MLQNMISISGGGLGIRTYDALANIMLFESATYNHSVTFSLPEIVSNIDTDFNHFPFVVSR